MKKYYMRFLYNHTTDGFPQKPYHRDTREQALIVFFEEIEDLLENPFRPNVVELFEGNLVIAVITLQSRKW